jgi:hypothetical protein
MLTFFAKSAFLSPAMINGASGSGRLVLLIAAIFRRFACEFDAEIAVLIEYLRFILKIDCLHKCFKIRWLHGF